MAEISRRQFARMGVSIGSAALLAPAAPSFLAPRANVAAAAQARQRLVGGVPATTFQTSSAYNGAVDIRTEGVMVYITNGGEDVESKIASWTGRGYVVEAMVSASHDPGDYWATGEADGWEHWDSIQELADGEKFSFAGLFHYATPSPAWIDVHVELAERIIAAGAVGIYYEEPEFWNHTGYEAQFRREWAEYYGTPWEDPTGSDAARWRSEQLKSHLYTRFLGQVSARIKGRHPDVRVMVAAHSNPNYNALGISYSGAAVAALPTIDAYVAQTWSNTASLPIPVEGADEVHVFAESMLEYSYFSHLARQLPDKPFMSLADPYADFGDPTQWDQYRRWYQQTVVAQLLQQRLDKFEVVPWPDRVFTAGTPSEYKSSLLTVFAVQREISENGWSASVDAQTDDVGLLTDDSLTWQHGIDDEHFRPANESFYGLGYPLVADGIAVNVIPADSLGGGDTDPLGGMSTILTSFEYWKPSSRHVVEALAAWVHAGRRTLVVFEGQSVFGDIGQWWSADGFATPEDALIDALGIGLGSGTQVELGQGGFLETTAAGRRLAARVGPVAVSSQTPVRSRPTQSGSGPGTPARELFCYDGQPVATSFPVGQGTVVWIGLSPTYAARVADGGRLVRGTVRFALQQAGRRYETQDCFVGRRGPYVAVAALRGEAPVQGTFVDVFDERLEIVTDPEVPADSAALLYDVETGDVPELVLTGGRITSHDQSAERTRYVTEGPSGTYTTARLAGNGLSPTVVRVLDEAGEAVDARWEWNNSTGSMLIRHDSRPAGVIVDVTWARERVPDSSDPISEGGISFSAGSEEEQAHLIEQVPPGGLTAEFRYADAAGRFTYMLSPGTANDGTLALSLVNNYVVELSADGATWHEVLNSAEMHGRDVKDGSNRGTQTVVPAPYAAESGDFRVRISDGSTGDGGGGGCYGLSITWLQGGHPTTP